MEMPYDLPLMKRGAEIEVLIDRLDRKGRGTGSVDGRTMAVRGGLPGQVVRVRVTRRRRLEGYVLEVVTRSPHEVDARCPHSGSCGGCAFQQLAYPVQLTALREQVGNAFAAAGLEVVVPEVIGCDPPFGYRNKMDFTFGATRWVEVGEPEGVERDFALGMHVSGRFDRVLDIQSCALHFDEADGLLTSAREVARAHGLPPWDVLRHTGLLRHLVLRKGFGTGEIMVDLVTSEDAGPSVDRWAEAMLERHPEVTTLVQNVNTRPASVAFGERERVIHGPGVITERIGDLAFNISANSFFQTNSRQAAVLFSLVSELAAPTGDEVVWDLYCGTGALSLAAARTAREVWGFELVDAAVADARGNAALNDLSNVHFIAGDVLASLGEGVSLDAPPPDLAIVDPPRAGLHPKVLSGLLRLAPPRIVYVSCNIHASAPQIATLVAEGGYDVECVRPVDMFPHTPHVECVVALRR
ncbi:MAG: 23S rRNA (uracil(1939)-C(5))-methyltransferase RlmD [Planctomycetes bacterium]|nr:23S rRNA (uracil(1939)-C(5))-methyltransferase RlmD [Planctomycetota bacterium]